MMRIRLNTPALAVLTIILGSGVLRADVPNPDPEIERSSFKLDDKFEINLFASDPMIEKPIEMNWDGRGRLWCATSQTYPQLAPGQVPNDKIIILEDTRGEGKADKSTVFADGLFIPNAVAPGDGGAYVTNSTEILHLKDTHGSGKADTRRVVLAGFGTEDTHHIVHTLKWGPDGRLYFLQSIYIHSHLETPRGIRTLLGSGVWRFNTRSLDLDVCSRGLVNPWGIVWDKWGQSFETDGAGGEGINYAFPGIGFDSAVGYEKVMRGLNPGSPKYASEEILSGTNVPDDYQGDILTNDFRANRIVRFKLSDNDSGFSSKQMPDFLTSTDPAFRPVDIRMGPDGAIYVADWYNPIINHGEVDFRDPRRDHTHGRIWRVTAKGRPLAGRPHIEGASVEQLLDLLKSPQMFDRIQAKLALRERDPKQVLPALQSWVGKINSSDPDADHQRVEALWTCENIDSVDPVLLQRVLKSDNPHARAAAVRVIGHWAHRLDNPLLLLEQAIGDKAPRVRLEAVRALATLTDGHAVVVATRALDQSMDPFLDYALWLTCNELRPIWMPAFQAGQLSNWGKAEHLNFALAAVKSPIALKTLIAQLGDDKLGNDARPGVMHLIATMLGPADANEILNLALTRPSGSEAQQNLVAVLFQATDRHVAPNDHPERIETLFSSPNHLTRVLAVGLSGFWKLESARADLEKFAQTPRGSDDHRLSPAAMISLGRLGGPRSTALLEKLASREHPTEVRMGAVFGLAQISVQDAAPRAAELVAAGESFVVDVFNAHEGGADALASALKSVKLSPDAAKLALRAVREAGQPNGNLMAVLSAAAGISGAPVKLSAQQMQQMVADVQARGNAERGEQVFRRADVGCYQCHAIAGAGGWLAPDLSSIGASSPVDYLVDSILDPNKAIKDGYQGYTIITNSGDAYSGIKVRQDNQQLVLRDNLHQEIIIPLADIKAQKEAGSLMPNGLADSLTQQELLDLVKFLSELGKPGPYASSPRQYVRRWAIYDPAPGERETGVRSPANATLRTPAYSLVSGMLPADLFSAGPAYAEGQINVTGSGKLRLSLNSPKGLAIWLDNGAIGPSDQIEFDATPGVHHLTFRVDPSQRPGQGLRAELIEPQGSSAHVQVVGGK